MLIWRVLPHNRTEHAPQTQNPLLQKKKHGRILFIPAHMLETFLAVHCIGISGFHANSDDLPQKSIIIQVLQPFVLVMMDFWVFPRKVVRIRMIS